MPRWTVEVLPLGGGETAKHTVDADSWLSALGRVQTDRQEPTSLADLSLEIRAEGGQAIDAMRRRRYVVTKSALISLVVHSSREEPPTSERPLLYRELTFVSEGIGERDAERALLDELNEVRDELQLVGERKFVAMAVFDGLTNGKPLDLPIATLVWKDWRGEPSVVFPRSGDHAPPSMVPVSLGGAPRVDAEPPSQKAPSVPPAPAAVRAKSPSIPPTAAAPMRAKAPSVPQAPVASFVKSPSSIPPAPAAKSPSAPSFPAAPLAKSPSAPSFPAAPVANTAVVADTAPLSLPDSAIEAAPDTPAPDTTPTDVPPPPAPDTMVDLTSLDRPSLDLSPRFSDLPPPVDPGRVRLVTDRPPADDLLDDLFDVMQDLYQAADSAAAGRVCVAAIQRVCPVRQVTLHAFDVDKRQFVAIASSGEAGDDFLLGRVPSSDPVLGQTARNRRTMIHIDVPPTKRFGALPSLRAVLTTPVVTIGRVVAVFELIDPAGGGEFNDGDAASVVYIAERFSEFVASNGLVFDAARVFART